VIEAGEEGEDREEPLLGHPVRIRDPCDVFVSSQDANGKPTKSYPLTSTKFQLGEFAGFVQEDCRGEDNDCFVLLDANLNPEDFVYGQEHSDSDSDSDEKVFHNIVFLSSDLHDSLPPPFPE
jgi:hypothetical protein